MWYEDGCTWDDKSGKYIETGIWTPYSAEALANVNKQKREGPIFKLVSDGATYVIDLDRQVQVRHSKSSHDGIEGWMRRIKSDARAELPPPTSRVHQPHFADSPCTCAVCTFSGPNLKDREDAIRFHGTQTLDLSDGIPSYWNALRWPKDSVFDGAVTLPYDHPLFHRCVATLLDATDAVKSCEIQRVVMNCNFDLFTAYQTHALLTNERGVPRGERWLFHGTKECAVSCILKSGYDSRYNRRQLLGPGTYFSADPSYCMQKSIAEVGRDGLQHIILSRVSLGKCLKYSKRRATQLSESSWGELQYPSPKGGACVKCEGYVSTQNDYQAYPEFVVVIKASKP